MSKQSVANRAAGACHTHCAEQSLIIAKRSGSTMVPLVLAAALVLGSSAAANAQSYGGASSGDLLGYRSSAGHYYNRSLSRRIADDVRRPPARRPSPRRGTSTTFRSVGPPIVPPQLAARRGPAERREALAYWTLMLDDYRQLLRDRQIAPNDVARAASFTIAASYEVLNGRTLGAAEFDALRAQMTRVVATDPDFARMSDRQKQELYETYAIVGMHMIQASAMATREGDHPRLAEVRRLASIQLEETFGRPPSRIAFTLGGVVFR